MTWIISICFSAGFLILAMLEADQGAHLPFQSLSSPGPLNAFFFSMFSAIFAFLGLSFSLNEQIGRLLSLLTVCISMFLFLASSVLKHVGGFGSGADALALAGAFMMILRTLGVAVLPPRGDRDGLVEAAGSVTLAGTVGLAWLLADPVSAPAAAAASLLLSWPVLVDGINAFADTVFHKAARAAGVRDLDPSALSLIGRARNILIDKTAVMSGPELTVTNVMAFNNEPKTLLAVAASAEAPSTHPVSVALRHLAAQWQVSVKTPDRFDPAPGLGVVALLGGQTVAIGTPDLLKRLKIDSFTADAIARSLEADGKTVLRVAVGGRVVGVLGLEGTLRQDAGVAGMALKSEGLTPWLFTNDSPNTREALGDLLGLGLPKNPQPGETVHEAAARLAQSEGPLVLTLSGDRMALELYASGASGKDMQNGSLTPLAVSDTDDIGAFPALKALAMRRDRMALRARGGLCGLWAAAGLAGALFALPLVAAPALFALCLSILLAFARLGATGIRGLPARA